MPEQSVDTAVAEQLSSTAAEEAASIAEAANMADAAEAAGSSISALNVDVVADVAGAVASFVSERSEERRVGK
jgi:hypothetical protein